MGKQPNIPNPAAASVAGIAADQQLQPFNYLINSAATLGQPITVDGKTYDFTGLGQMDTAGKVSDQMAQTLLDLQKETSPTIIAQRLAELKAADPQGFAARQQLFDKIMADADAHPGRPVATDLQQQIQTELAKGAGFDDSRQEQQVREGIRGNQVATGITLGNAATSNEAKGVVAAGENLRNQRETNAMNLLQSGASPEDVAYRQFQQSIGNLGAFENQQTPEAQFKSVSSAGVGPVLPPNGATPTNTFNPNAANQGLGNALSIYGGQSGYNMNQANPWLAGLSIGANTYSTVNQINNPWAPSNWQSNPSWNQPSYDPARA